MKRTLTTMLLLAIVTALPGCRRQPPVSVTLVDGYPSVSNVVWSVTVGYARPPDQDDPFSTALPQSASLCVFSVETGELRESAALGPYEYAGMFTTMIRSPFILNGDHCHFLWIKRHPGDSSLSLVMTTLDLKSLRLTHETVRKSVSGNTPLSTFVSDCFLHVGVTVHGNDPCRLAGRWSSLTAKAAPGTVKSPF